VVIGIGIDIVHLPGFQKILDNPASHFVAAHFTENETRYAEKNPTKKPVQHLAVQYAAKEAFIKALGQTNYNQPKVIKSVDYKEIEILNDEEKRPYLELHGRVKEVSRAQGVKRAFVTLAHDGDMAIAEVLLEG